LVKEFFKSLSDARYIAGYLHGAYTPNEYQARIQELRTQGYI